LINKRCEKQRLGDLDIYLPGELIFEPPHSDVATARNGRGQASDTGKMPPIAVALVPDAALARNRECSEFRNTT
jgi:hypothetical protein